jgi:hypothetical protein
VREKLKNVVDLAEMMNQGREYRWHQSEFVGDNAEFL